MTGFAQYLRTADRARLDQEVRRAERAIHDPRRRLSAATAAGLGYALASLVPLGRLPHARTAAVFGGAAAALIPSAAWVSSVRGGRTASTGPAGDEAPAPSAMVTLRRTASVAAVSAAVGTVVGGSLWLSLKADAGLERLAVRCGARHPRLWMGVVGGVLGGLVEFAERTPPPGDRRPASLAVAGVRSLPSSP